jgi:hypothetical protein
MRTLKVLMLTAVLALSASAAVAETLNLANCAPSDAAAVIETVDMAGLRQMMLDSKFYAALQQTEAFRQWRASPKYAEMQTRIETLLGNLEMTRDEALRTYLGGRSAVILMPTGDKKKPDGIIAAEVTNAKAEQLIKACGGLPAGRHLDVAIWEVRKDGRVDRMAFAGNVLLITGAQNDTLERVLDVVVGGGASLGTEGHFQKAVDGLPAGWRVRAYAASAPPRHSPGAVAMYPQGEGRVHLEWRQVSGEGDISATAPVALTGPGILPESAVAAVSTALHTQAIWDKVKAKLQTQADGEAKLRKADLFIRGWFPGQSLENVLAAFGPEASAAVLKGDNGAAPGVLIAVKLTAGGGPAATAFKDGLAAKAMILSALSQNKDKGPQISIREEVYGAAQLLVIEATGDGLQKILGEWAKDIGLTVAVNDAWLIVGTTPASVKATLDTIAGDGKSLAASLTAAGEKVPAEPVTNWGVVQPVGASEIILKAAEMLAGKARVEEARKAANLAELLTLVKRIVWQRTDEPTVIRGQTDIQAID